MAKYTQDERAIAITKPLGKDVLLLEKFSGSEGVSQLFRFELNLLTDPAQGRHRTAAHFEYVFRYPVQVLVFLFGLVNGGVLIRGFDDGTWAVLLAGVAGRPVGVVVAVGLAVAAGLELPQRFRWRDVVVIALVASSSFTFGLFFATAVFPVGPTLIQTKIGAMLTVAGAPVAIVAARLVTRPR